PAEEEEKKPVEREVPQGVVVMETQEEKERKEVEREALKERRLKTHLILIVFFSIFFNFLSKTLLFPLLLAIFHPSASYVAQSVPLPKPNEPNDPKSEINIYRQTLVEYLRNASSDREVLASLSVLYAMVRSPYTSRDLLHEAGLFPD